MKAVCISQGVGLGVRGEVIGLGFGLFVRSGDYNCYVELLVRDEVMAEGWCLLVKWQSYWLGVGLCVRGGIYRSEVGL